jgi:hypothetical protein
MERLSSGNADDVAAKLVIAKAIVAQKKLVGLRVAALTKISSIRERKREIKREINHYNNMKPDQFAMDATTALE